jgi:curved DNA-binding protein CbpA
LLVRGEFRGLIGMTDFFALLGEPRRPWLDAENLKTRFHELSARHHPDAGGEDARFAEINRANQVLADPGLRLRHLLELELQGALPRTQDVPDVAAKFFAPVAEATRAADVFFKKHAATNSPLAKALLSAEQYRVQEEVERLIGELQAMQDDVLEKVREVDGIWDTKREEAMHCLPELWQALGYAGKWLGTLREILFRLAALEDG